MAAAEYQCVAASAEALLSHSAFRCLPSLSPPPLPTQAIEPPRFEPSLVGLHDKLMQCGCSAEAARALEAVYEDSCRQLASQCAAAFSTGLHDLSRSFRAGEGALYHEWQHSLVLAFERQYQESAARMHSRLLDEVRSA
ncbi:homeodomain transcription factor HD2, partial [Rhodotorula diobovata]